MIKTAETHPFARSEVLGFPIDRMTLDQCVQHFDEIIPRGEPRHIVLVNAAKIVKARKDSELAHIIRTADYVGADGVPIVWASRLLHQPLPGRVNGTDLMERLFELANRKGYRVYLLGATQPVIEATVRTLNDLYPRLMIVGYRNGYFSSPLDEEKAVRDIAALHPDILMIGMGTPMKEKWVRRHFNQLHATIVHGVGGSFDILGGITKRAPGWMQRNGLEWFYRLCQEPGRMWKRYLVTNSIYIGLVLKEYFRLVFCSSKDTVEFNVRGRNETV